MNMNTREVASLLFDHWYCENGLPLDTVSDRDKFFTSKFWKALHQLTGVKLKMSTTYHSQTDGSSERTNKTVDQLLRYRHQTVWLDALPRVRFNLMSTINASTGYSNFQLHLGRTPRRLPPLTPDGIRRTRENCPADVANALEAIVSLKKPSRMLTTLCWHLRLHATNNHRNNEPTFEIGDPVYLATAHRRREYLNGDNKRVAKFMPRFDGPYNILSANPKSSTYTLDLPEHTNVYPTFHASELKRHIPNDATLYPSRKLQRPGPIVTATGSQEWEIEEVLDKRKRRRGYGAENDVWVTRQYLEGTDVLQEY